MTQTREDIGYVKFQQSKKYDFSNYKMLVDMFQISLKKYWHCLGADTTTSGRGTSWSLSTYIGKYNY